MDNFMGGGGEGGIGGAVGQFPLEQWFYEMPVCTRLWTTATLAASVLVQCQVITPFQLFYSFRSVFIKSQVGVLLTMSSKSMAERNWICSGLCFPGGELPAKPDGGKDIGKWKGKLTRSKTAVLATRHQLPLLWPAIARPPLPRLLPTTLFPPPRGVFRTIARTLFMAATVCHGVATAPVRGAEHAFPRLGLEQLARVHMVTTKQRDSVELSRPAGVYGAVSTVGVDGLQPGLAQHDSQGRDLWRHCWAW